MVSLKIGGDTMLLRRLCAIILLTLFVTGCETAPQAPRYLPFTIGKSQPVYLNVSGIEFIDQYKPPFVSPNVEHTFPIKTYDAIHKLVEDRLQPNRDASAQLKVTILDASVVEESLDRTPGIKGVFTNDQSDRYRGKMEVQFEIYEAGFLLPRAKYHVRVERSGTIDERASYQDRQDFFYTFTQGMIEQLNQQMQEGLNKYFIDYIQQ